MKSSDLTGFTLGKYKLTARIGRGGMARVYKARQQNLNRDVAVKVMHAHLAEEDEFVGRFLQEASAVAQLRHSHIVHVFDFDIQDDFYYMVLEYIDGPTLKAELQARDVIARPFSLAEVVTICSSLADAIDYAHVRSIVHRDLKPANIMFTGDGQVVLTDFGIIRLVGSSGFTRTGLIAGTPAYMSPEQAQSKPVDGRSDIYSLGVILFELMTGRQPFTSDNPLQVLRDHASNQPPLPGQLNPDISTAVEEIILKAMAKNPDDRFQRASEMAFSLRQALHIPAETMFTQKPIQIFAQPTMVVEPSLAETIELTATKPQDCPYRGLFAFREEDAPYFYGREEYTEQLLKTTRTKPMVAIVGPSGSGKSSIVFAGLLPQLRADDSWLICDFRPGSRPFESLTEALIPALMSGSTQSEHYAEAGQLATELRSGKRRLSDVINDILSRNRKTNRVLLVSDQFEEIYTLCDNADLRTRFLDSLLDAVDVQKFHGEPSFTLLLTLRTDFLGQALTHRQFSDALQDADVKLGPMTRRELSQAVSLPAHHQGRVFETGLIARILDDVGDEPGNLPLLEFALTELWEQPLDGRLTHKSYDNIGEVEGALAGYADKIYNGLATDEQTLARQVFIQMVRPGAGTEDTRRLATRAELGEDKWQLVQKLADARLVVTSRDPFNNETVEVVHEALIRGWGQLRTWMTEDRAFRTWQDRLRAALRQWQASEKDDSALLRGVLLAEAEGWLAERGNYLNEAERAYIEKSLLLRETQRIEAEKVRLEHDRAETNARYVRILTLVSLALFAAIITASFLAYTAFQNGREAEDLAKIAQENEAAARAAQIEEERQREIAEAERAAAELSQEEAEAAKVEEERQRQIAEEERDAARAAEADAEAAQAELEMTLAELADIAEQASINAENAVASAHEAQSHEVASEAEGQLGNDPMLGLLLAIEAVNIPLAEGQPPPAAAENILFRAMQASQLVRSLAGHAEEMTDIAFSPDGRYLATVGRDRELKLWDTSTWQVVKTLTGHGRPINTVAFSPDSTMLASAGEDGSVLLWNVETFNFITNLQRSDGAVNDVAFSPNSLFLAAAYENDVAVVWDIAMRRSAFEKFESHNAPVTSVAYAPDGVRLITGSEDGFIIIWNAEVGSIITSVAPEEDDEGEVIAIHSLAYSPNGERFVSALANGLARVWDAETAEHLFALSGHARPLREVAFSPDGGSIATASDDGTTKVWDAETGQILYTLSGHTSGLTAVAFHPQDDQIATASQDTTARVWNASPGLTPIIMAGHRGPIEAVAFNEDGSLVATGSSDQFANIWDADSGELMADFSDHNGVLTDVTFDPNGRFLATASADWDVRLWDLNTEQLLEPILFHDSPVRTIDISEDGNLLVSTSESGMIWLWDVTSHDNLLKFGDAEQSYLDAVFSPDSQQIATANADGTVTIWETTTGEPLQTLEGVHEGPVNHILFNADSTQLVTAGGDNTAKLWDLATGERLNTFSGHQGPVLSITLNRDGSRLATASVDNTIRLWNTATGQVVRTFEGHTSRVNDVQFSPDGLHLATASADRTARVHTLDTIDELFARALELAERPLTSAECTQYLRRRPCITANNTP